MNASSSGEGPTFARRGLALRWRVALLSSVAIALLSVMASLTAFQVVRSSLRGDLQRALRLDVEKVAELYGSGGQGGVTASLSGPTGGLVIQLYDPAGFLLASSEGVEQDGNVVEPGIVVSALDGLRDWQGSLGGRPVQAALAPFAFGVAAVLADTAFIGRALTQLARALLATATVLVLLSAGIGYLVAAAGIRPIARLAQLAADLGPQNLRPIAYRGPEDEVSRLSRVLNDLVLRLKASLDAQRSFLAETSHELRTPLTSLQGFLERSLRRAPPELERDLGDARRIAESMSRLVADLLQLSRGQLVQELVPHLLDPYEDILVPVAEEFPGVRLEGRPGCLLLGDPDRLRQLLRNLAANAVRAAGGPEAVALSLRERGDRLELQVRDSGPGIPEGMRQRIFEKFYRGAGGGSGLGLAIARQIAELHRGAIEIESEPGNTVFTVVLPTVEAPD